MSVHPTIHPFSLAVREGDAHVKDDNWTAAKQQKNISVLQLKVCGSTK